MGSSHTDRPWWTHSVVYQIYPRSFASAPVPATGDTGHPTGEGGFGTGDEGSRTGDLRGIRSRLPYLAWLGIDAIWLSPIFASPQADFGYDVSDYCAIDPRFGTLDDLDALVAEAHERGLRVLLDWVPNHTSVEHEWFRSSRSSRTDPKRDWYVWRDPAPDGGPPNNWVASLVEQPAWTFDETTGQWYLHNFLPDQPDLNWANPEVVAAMHDVVRFWLDRGIDGFRVDVAHLLGKDPALADDPPELIPLPHVILNDRPETHEHLRGLRTLFDSYPGDRMMVGEVYLLDTEVVATYYGDHDELHLSFNFPPLRTAWRADRWRQQIETTMRALDAVGAWPTWVLSNHDVVRHASRYGSEARARAAAVLLLSLRGTPFLYAGEELGLADAVIPPDRAVDPGGRDGCRAPIPWTPDPDHGWGTDDPWLPWPPDPEHRNVESERDDPASILHLYRRLLHARRGSPALTGGDQVLLDAPQGVLAFERTGETERRVVLINFTAEPVELGPACTGTWSTDAETTTDTGAGSTGGGLSDGGAAGTEPAGAGAAGAWSIGTVVLASDGVGEGRPFVGTLSPDQAVILDPTR